MSYQHIYLHDDENDYRKFLMEMQLRKYEIDKHADEVDQLMLLKMHELRIQNPEYFKLTKCEKVFWWVFGILLLLFIIIAEIENS